MKMENDPILSLSLTTFSALSLSFAYTHWSFPDPGADYSKPFLEGNYMFMCTAYISLYIYVQSVSKR